MMHQTPAGGSPTAVVPTVSQGSKQIRLWVDGVWDLTHYGHFNALRQAALLGDALVVGISTSQDVAHHKGSLPILADNERVEMMAACKWVDQVVLGIPWTTSLEFIAKFEVDYVAHGSDTSTDADGNDTYAGIKAANKFKEYPRTEGISTSGLIHRILARRGVLEGPQSFSCFVPSSMLVDFQAPRKLPPQQAAALPLRTAAAVVVYVEGSFDLLHAGHMTFLKKIKAELFPGCFLLVGLHNSSAAIMSISERAMGLLGCRYVDDVILEAPVDISEAFLQRFHVDKVVVGTVRNSPGKQNRVRSTCPSQCLVETVSPSSLTSSQLVERVTSHADVYVARTLRKQQRDKLAGIQFNV